MGEVYEDLIGKSISPPIANILAYRGISTTRAQSFKQNAYNFYFGRHIFSKIEIVGFYYAKK